MEWQHNLIKTKAKHFLRFATLKYYPLVFPMTHVQNEAGICAIGMPCRYPFKNAGRTVWRAMCCTGLILEILENVIRDLDIEYDLYIVEDGSFGGFQNGSWTGIMNDVYTGKADVGVHAMSQLPERLDYVDYTEPILGSWFGIVRRRESSKMDVINWIFLSKLDQNLILAVWGVFFINFLFTFAYENFLLTLEISNARALLVPLRSVVPARPGRQKSAILVEPATLYFLRDFHDNYYDIIHGEFDGSKFSF